MELTKEIVQGLLILLPGFVTTGVIRSLYVGGPENDFDKVVKSLVFTFVDYVVYSFLLLVRARLYHLKGSPHPVDVFTGLPSSPGDLVALFLVSVAVGMLVSFYRTQDGHRWWLTRLGITKRTTRHNVWHDAFIDFGKKFVIVNFEDDKRLFGWPLHYNDDADEPFLYLNKAEWLTEDEDGNQISTPVGDQGIMILPTMKIASIEFFSSANEKKAPNPLRRTSTWCRNALEHILD